MLSNLTSSLQATLSLLQGPLKPCLESILHDPDRIPDANCLKLAAEAVDLLGQTQKLLDPGVLILADHILGESDLSYLYRFKLA
jgi:gliotoxin/aspirochlorine biosynthesis O-methyltransferase